MAWAGFASYDPLDRRNLARSVEQELLSRPQSALPPPEPFVGAGLYALYYVGDHPAYAPISDGEVPVYVGQAAPSRPMDWGTDPVRIGTVLYARLGKDAVSLDQACDLDRSDFRCRYLVVDDVWLSLARNVLVDRYQPVWNTVLRGFGSHNPGSKRGSSRSNWDEAHPGRPWADRLPRAQAGRDELFDRVSDHLGRDSIL